MPPDRHRGRVSPARSRGVRAVRRPRGLHAATPDEAKLCGGADVVVVGGGNSAGQAAVFLSQHVRKVFLAIRGDDLYRNMSSYLAHRIEENPNVEILFNATVRRMCGDRSLNSVEILDGRTGQTRTVETPGVFSFIGAVPRTDWLPPEIERCPKGFVKTGASLAESPAWTARRQPFLSNPAGPASSPPATRGPTRSSGSRRPSGKARCPSSSSTST